MTPGLWIAATVLIFAVGFIGQLLRRNRRPWLVPLVAAGGFAISALVLTQIALPMMRDAMLQAIERTKGK